MRWMLYITWTAALQSMNPHFSVTKHEVQSLRRCQSDSELARRRRRNFRHPHIHQHYHIQTPTAPYAPDYNRQQGLEQSWLSCTPAQATVKAAYIGCFATVTAGLGAALIGVLAS